MPKVRERLDHAARGEGDPDSITAQAEIDRLLAEDNASGFVFEDDWRDAQIIAFPGVTRPRPEPYGPFTQYGTLDGILISVGGADRTKHVQLQSGEINYTGIETDRETARRLGKHLFEPVRIAGQGEWVREADGSWTLKRFHLRDFEVLRSDNLRDVVDELRKIKVSSS